MLHSLGGQTRLFASAQAPCRVQQMHSVGAKFPRVQRGRQQLYPLRCSKESADDGPSDSAAATVSDGAETASSEEIMSGRQLYNPQSYETLVKDATNAAVRAIEAGETRIEVEFPPPGGTNSEWNDQLAYSSRDDS